MQWSTSAFTFVLVHLCSQVIYNCGVLVPDICPLVWISLQVIEITFALRRTNAIFTLPKDNLPFALPQRERTSTGMVDNRFPNLTRRVDSPKSGKHIETVFACGFRQCCFCCGSAGCQHVYQAHRFISCCEGRDLIGPFRNERDSVSAFEYSGLVAAKVSG